MMSKLNVFVTGQTGFIGGTAMEHMLKNPVAQERFAYRSLVRSDAHAKEIQAMGITPVFGSLDDGHLLAEEASKADMVLHFANADHISSIRSICKGLMHHGRRQLARPILIHTSGAGVLFDGAKGAPTNDVFSDDNLAKVINLPETAFHRDVELVVLDPSLHEVVDTYIVSPPTIWGVGTGVGNRHSIQIPFQIKNALQQHRVYRVGQGMNRMSRIHVEDLADFYVQLATRSIQQPNNLPKGRDGYYFVEKGEIVYGDVSKIIADEMYHLGVAPDANVYETPNDKEEGYWMPNSYLMLGCNARTRAVLGGKFLGWTPKHGLDNHEFDQYVRDEVKYLNAAQVA